MNATRLLGFAFVIAFLFLVILTAGCVNMQPLSTETKIEESVFIATDLTDMAQTIQAVGRNPQCYHETGYFGLIGREPTTAKIVGINAAYILGHLGITELLSQDGGRDYPSIRPWALRLWELISTGEIVSSIDFSYKAHGGQLFVPTPACNPTTGQLYR